MKRRRTIMKHIVIVAVAVLSFVISIPLSHSAAIKVEHPTSIKHSIVSKAVSKKIVAVATPAVQTVSYTLTGGCEQYLSLVEQYNWNVSIAMAIMQAESTAYGSPCYYEAVGTASYDGIDDYGLFQLHGIDILDPAQNVAYAYYHKYLTQGWEAWSTYNNGAYLRYL